MLELLLDDEVLLLEEELISHVPHKLAWTQPAPP